MDTGEARVGSKLIRSKLHSDKVICTKGVTYAVRYVGNLEITTSMRNLDFETRSLVAKECINRVCEVAGLKTINKKQKTDKKVLRSISDTPSMEHAGSNVNLTISSSSLTISSLETGQTISCHDTPRISFASGGDIETLDFVAYVAKNLNNYRACYVLECGGGLAQDVIATIAQAFELRFQEFMIEPSATIHCMEHDRDYYNDLPNKVPPDMALPSLPKTAEQTSNLSSNRPISVNNLIDLNTPTCCKPIEHNYVNDLNIDTGITKDVFDMQPFQPAVLSDWPIQPLTAESQRNELLKENWFHGPISRVVAEGLVKTDGDFLVRESRASPGQYVLTGIQGVNKKHLLLIDPKGVVRTRDRMFESISHLINYHCVNALPIISSETALMLRNPILKSQ